MSVRSSPEVPSRFPLGALVRASSLHVGAAAAAAALRRDLVDSGRLSADQFDEAYAVARVTPGTNLLAMYVLLGERFRGWAGAIGALLIGACVPATIAVLIGAVYVAVADRAFAELVMRGARAGALGVFAWAVIRLATPQLRAHSWRGLAVVAVTSGLLWLAVPTVVVLLIAGALGAVVLRDGA